MIIIGGRNSGATSAIYMSEQTKANITSIEKDVKLNATLKYIERLLERNVNIITGGNVIKINGENKLESVIIKKNNENIEIKVDYLFLCIGTLPNYSFLNINIKRDEFLRIVVDPLTMETSIENLFAVGDINQLLPKQISNATANGKTAVYYIGKRLLGG